VIAPRVLTPRLVPAVILNEGSMFITTGNLTTPKTSPTIPPTNPMANPDTARTKEYNKSIGIILMSFNIFKQPYI
jgi:hypothetical protein